MNDKEVLEMNDKEVLEMNDAVTVGDLKSSARGSGARCNGSKPQWWQLPLFALQGIDIFYAQEGGISVLDVIDHLAIWQRESTGSMTLQRAIADLLYLLAAEQSINPSVGLPLRALESTTRVLEFGAKKYPATDSFAIGTDGRPTPASAGNWAKGMPWSVCLSCALSHLFANAGGEINDEESGLSHLAHAMCNLLFLISYVELYPEGDDRIKQLAHPSEAFRFRAYDMREDGTIGADGELNRVFSVGGLDEDCCGEKPNGLCCSAPPIFKVTEDNP
jgi:Domain of unknown function (DUF5664)